MERSVSAVYVYILSIRRRGLTGNERKPKISFLLLSKSTRKFVGVKISERNKADNRTYRVMHACIHP